MWATTRRGVVGMYEAIWERWRAVNAEGGCDILGR